MSRHRIGVDLGGTKIEIAILAPDGSEVLRHRIDTPHGYQATLEAIARLVQDAEAQLGITATVGIGIPGVISPATGLVKNANSIALNGLPFDRDVSAPARPARCASRTTPTASPCPRRPTAPVPASAWCSASSSAPAAAAAS